MDLFRPAKGREIQDITDAINKLKGATGTTTTVVNSSTPSTPVTAENIGTGEGGVYKEEVNSVLKLRTIKAGTSISIVQNANDITISAVPTFVGLAIINSILIGLMQTTTLGNLSTIVTMSPS